MEQLWPVDGVSVPEMLGGEPMTDDKRAGDGPYVTFFLDGHFGWIVRDQSMTIRDGLDQSEAEILCVGMNEAHAAGRKAERERCAKIAENSTSDIPEFNMTGHGIAKLIRGGQDAK